MLSSARTASIGARRFVPQLSKSLSTLSASSRVRSSPLPQRTTFTPAPRIAVAHMHHGESAVRPEPDQVLKGTQRSFLQFNPFLFLFLPQISRITFMTMKLRLTLLWRLLVSVSLIPSVAV